MKEQDEHARKFAEGVHQMAQESRSPNKSHRSASHPSARVTSAEASGTIPVIGDEQSKQPMNRKITIGIIILMIGVILLIISSDMTPRNTREIQSIEALKNTTMLLGLVLLTVGGIISARGFASKRSSHQQPSPTSSLDELEKLASLKEKGIITEEEYEKKKKQILEI